MLIGFIYKDDLKLLYIHKCVKKDINEAIKAMKKLKEE